MNSLTVVVEPSHPMASSNTKNKNIFRLANGNYISRMAFVHIVAPTTDILTLFRGCVDVIYTTLGDLS